MFVAFPVALSASVGANSGIVRRCFWIGFLTGRFGFSRREFRNREAVILHHQTMFVPPGFSRREFRNREAASVRQP